jgi:thermitase
VARLRALPGVEFAEPNYTFTISDVDDPLYPEQWSLDRVSAPSAWNLTIGNPAVLVAVLDTGADLNHPDLAGQIAGSQNFVGFGAATDENGHGTHTAGTIAARTNNGIGVASLGYQTRLLIGKVATDRGVGSVAAVVQGLEWAVANGARVVNMSFTFAGPSTALEDAVNDAWNHGIVVVAAAGNSGSSIKTYPGAYEHCIAVAATTAMDARAGFSNYGPWVSVAAPGDEILSLYKHGQTAYMSGTSMAAPHVSALAALLWANGGRSNDSIRYAIVSSGSPTLGFGAFPVLRINARNALLRIP